ncbi:MAG: hypothetical protein NC305_11330 [Lachnospiraceae bacterium]|nr:hypothetical protein [Butyrivibrio sp.]MCM1344143.1 hypothetical protein [Muribaculaceae bacterium]MCM1411125.1 hypothetical protein [Lachnospiraceae bacterium]
MARRPAFYVHQEKVTGRLYSFEWFPGFAVSQKQKSIESLHDAIRKADTEAMPLEISTKGREPLGQKLSAFHLTLGQHTLENIFQSSKVFEKGGPYLDLLEVPPREAKHDERLKNSGQLKSFCFQGETFPLFPLTAFYDYLYYAAVKESLAAEEITELSKYDYFTDIEFNPDKSVNTQARTAAMIRLILEEYGTLPDFTKDDFIQYHREHIAY